MRHLNHDRARNRRGPTIAGVAGLASLLGAGAVLAGCAAPEKTSGQSQVATRAAAQQALPATSGAPAEPGRPRGPMGPVVPGSGGSDDPRTTQERLDDARGANERLGTTVRRPRAKTVTDVDPSKIRTVEKGTLKKDKRTLRIVSSRQDLTDYRELGWIGDEGVRYGKARCSRTIQVSDKPPAEKPTLMMCWRTTPKKSVYTITVDLTRKPTAREGVAALNREWKRMG